MNFKDCISLRGEVVITSTDATGKITTLVNDRNLIVLAGRTFLANSLVNSASNVINSIVFGSGGTVPGSPSQVLAVNPTDTGVNTVITGLTSNVDYTFATPIVSTAGGSPNITFNISIPEGTTGVGLNGQGVNEMALMLNTSTPIAFAIKRFSTITKSPSISISISWVIYL